MDHLQHCDALGRELEAFDMLLDGADFATQVPTCQRWDLLRLTSHLGGVHRWCESMVREVAQERLDRREQKPDASNMAAWFHEGGQLLLNTLRAADPEAPMFAWGTDQHVRFWSRRQVHETAIHRFDAANAIGAAFTMPADLAHDSVDEFLDNLPRSIYFAPNVEKLKGNGESIHLHATDTDGEWLINLTPDGFNYEHGHGKGSVAARGAISDLALLIWGRVPLDEQRFETFGDAALLQHWLANSAL